MSKIYEQTYGKEMFDDMIKDWLTDNAEEMEDLEINKTTWDEERQRWYAWAKDEKCDYLLLDDGRGNIRIEYMDSHQ